MYFKSRRTNCPATFFVYHRFRITSKCGVNFTDRPRLGMVCVWNDYFIRND